MEDILAKIRWNIDFIKEETIKVDGSPEIKELILNNCKIFIDNIGECFEANADKEKVEEIMKPALIEFDKIIKKIKNEGENKILFMLLITHIADIKFLLSNKKDNFF